MRSMRGRKYSVTFLVPLTTLDYVMTARVGALNLGVAGFHY
jgi:hypothetical protein